MATAEYYRRQSLKYNFGITLEEYDALFDSQDGKCAICLLPPSGRQLAVDHDHKTGKIRGLLCTKCNVALGLLNDDIGRLFLAIEYLKSQTRG
jgi:hypothetical protein